MVGSASVEWRNINTWLQLQIYNNIRVLDAHSVLAQYRHHAYNDMDGPKGVDHTAEKVDGTKAGENRRDVFVNKKRVRERQAYVMYLAKLFISEF